MHEATAVTTTVESQNTGATLRTPEVDGGVNNLEKVRDLLFGVQMRDYDRKFTTLEERIVRETSELREDVKKRLTAIEQLLARESTRLQSDKTDRASLAALLTEMAMRLTDDFKLPTTEDAGRG
jgi:hypothetical protein